MKKNSRLHDLIGYRFCDDELLARALSHRSVGKQNNERLEFLGDSLLNLIIAEALYTQFSQASEGDLSRLRASLVKGDTLAEIAREKTLGEYLLLGEGEMKSGGFRRASILADTVEAIIGAIYIEAGMEVCRTTVLAWFADRLSAITLDNTDKDPKTRLQEYLQSIHKPLPSYQVLSAEEGSAGHAFEVACKLPDRDLCTTASAATKRAAEKSAARKMLLRLGLD